MSFRFLRPGPGERLDVIEVEAGDLPDPGQEIRSWRAIPGKRARTRVQRAESGSFTVRIGKEQRFWLNPSTHLLAACPSKYPALREMLLWTTPVAIALSRRGCLALHAAAIEIRGRVLLLTAPSGSGKSSTAAAFHAAGYRVLSDDLGCIRFSTHHGPEVLPGPAVLRLRTETTQALDLSDLSPADAEGTKPLFTLPEGRRGSSEGVPLAGVVFIENREGPISLARMDRSEAVSCLWPLSFHLPDHQSREQCFGSLVGIVNEVPVWRLERAFRWEVLSEVVDRLASDLIP